MRLSPRMLLRSLESANCTFTTLTHSRRSFHLSIKTNMPVKRKAPASTGYSDSTGNASNKRSAESQCSRKVAKRSTSAEDTSVISNAASPEQEKFDHTRVEEKAGIVQREFYPHEMSNERCARYNNNELPRPIQVLEQTIADTQEQRDKIAVGDAVVHWFKRDLRLRDNKALSMAARKAKEGGVPLVCIFVVSPQDYQAHFTSAARVDFELRTLAVIKEDLAGLDVPLLVETVEKQNRVPGFLLKMCKDWGANHLFCNMEYEVDELRRETGLMKRCLDVGIDFTVVHDDVVVPPGALQTGAGKQYAVYSPWFRSWIAHVHKHPELLVEHEKPGQNPAGAREKFKQIFDTGIPDAPKNKTLSIEQKKRLASLWPAGEHEAFERLDKFLKQKATKYKDMRNLPAAGSTAMVSVHHSAGTLAARTSVRLARDANSSKKLDGGNAGIAAWISEVAWRDFYKHVLAHWPYIWQVPKPRDNRARKGRVLTVA